MTSPPKLGVQETITISVEALSPEQRQLLLEEITQRLAELSGNGEQVRPAVSELNGWTPEAMEAVLARLEAMRHHSQVKAIREAAQAPNGVISRERVYEIAGYEEKRSLRGFTRPINKLVQDLVNAGSLSRNADKLFSPTIENGRAARFTVPAAVVAQSQSTSTTRKRRAPAKKRTVAA